MWTLDTTSVCLALWCRLKSLEENLLRGKDGEFVLILKPGLALWVKLNRIQSALFNFQSLLLVILLLICTSTYLHNVFPGIMDRNKDGYGLQLELCTHIFT